ncbi:hypothetical protein ACI789_16720 [Geodermatophilus sp. SYSU D00965]
MDTRVVLALHALGVTGFAAGRTAAVPRPATGFSFEDLRFWPAEEAEDSRRAEAFALLLNSRLRPPFATPEPRLLWDVYGEVLDPARVRLAERTPTPEEQARHDAAKALLTPQVLSTYFSCRQAVGTALVDLATVRASRPDPSTGSEAAWQAQVALAEDRVAAAQVELQLTGRAGEVEAAMAVVDAWPGAATAVSWSEHRQQFELADVGSLDGVSSYFLTRFVPTDVLEGRGWVRFELPGSRIGELIAGLPPEVAAAGGEPAQDADIDRLTVELSYVQVLRPWFDPGVLRSRAWRYADDTSPVVSDGGTPAAGDFPYLVTGLVLARNLELTAASGTGGGTPPLRLGYLRHGIEMSPPSALPGLRPPVPIPEPDGPRVVDVSHVVRPDPVDGGLLVDRDPPVLARRETDLVEVVHPRWRAELRSRRLTELPVRLRTWLADVDFASPDVSTTPTTPPSPSTRVLVGADEAIVVAYLLEPVGPAPAPDPGLSWP